MFQELNKHLREQFPKDGYFGKMKNKKYHWVSRIRIVHNCKKIIILKFETDEN